jgi:hypothetical protein
VECRAEALAAGEEVFMAGDIPIIWILLGFNGLFLGAFVYRRITEKPRLPGPLSFVAQASFIAVNCLILFPKEAELFVDWLMRLF